MGPERIEELARHALDWGFVDVRNAIRTAVREALDAAADECEIGCVDVVSCANTLRRLRDELAP